MAGGMTYMEPELLFDYLHRMDCEATTLVKGTPTGLNWYGGHGPTRDGLGDGRELVGCEPRRHECFREADKVHLLCTSSLQQ